MNKIRVMIVEDSRVVREFLTYLIARDPRLEVAVAVGSGEEALRVLERISPDVISMDIRLPGMNGFEATQLIMARKPTPIVVVSASVDAEDLKISMNALRAGALAVMEKPAGTSHADYASLAERLCTQLAIMSQVKVIRQRIDRGLRFGPTERAKAADLTVPSAGPFTMLGLVASTGGPNALTKLLGGLPRDFPLPVILVQHITACFLDGFASWLDSISPLRVKLAKDGEVALPGKVYLPPADRHLKVVGGRLQVDGGDFVCLQRPSGTVLFQSMARSLGAGSLGVLLTGMGEDGAEGLRHIRQAGGYTIAEDESTTVVYGMPAAAVRLGAVCESLPLPEIAPRIVALVGAEGSR
jgi:two-component system, chemotaxis family, protein-glutamate methylesterase/glutaminase